MSARLLWMKGLTIFIQARALGWHHVLPYGRMTCCLHATAALCHLQMDFKFPYKQCLHCADA